MRLRWCCVELHHGNFSETLSLLLLAVTKLRRNNPASSALQIASTEAKEYIREYKKKNSLKPMNVTHAGR